MGSKSVPPSGIRTKRLSMTFVLCDLGKNHNAPLSVVQVSKGIQNPSAEGGSVYWTILLQSCEDQLLPTRKVLERDEAFTRLHFFIQNLRIAVFRD